MPFYEHGFGGRIVMLCQVCKSACHPDGPKEVFVQDKETGAFRKAMCPLCICHDCVQVNDDPVRRQLAPLILGQTMESGPRIVLERDGGKHTENMPGPFSIEKAIAEMRLGLVYEEPKKAHALPTPRSASCACAAVASARCISCSEAFCPRCLKAHECREGGPE